MWCDSCAAKDQEIADLRRKIQAADEQLLELRNAATEATEAWNSWERSCEQKDAEIADLKRQLENSSAAIRSLEDQLSSQRSKIEELNNKSAEQLADHSIAGMKLVADKIDLERQLAEARKDMERLDWLERRRLALNAHYGTKYGWKFVASSNVTRLFVSDVNTIDLHDSAANAGNIREAIDAAREGK